MATNDDADLGQDDGDLEEDLDDEDDVQNLHTVYDRLDRALMLNEPDEIRLAAETALAVLGQFLDRTPSYPVFTSRTNLDLWW
jgi:hypothetical protein